MKSKLVLTTLVAILGFAALAQNAMAGSSRIVRPSAVGKSVSRGAVTKSMTKVPKKAAVPSHTILPGAKNNA